MSEKEQQATIEFDWKFYTEFYDDLKHFSTEEEAYQHWINFGKIEGRCASEEDLYIKCGNELPEDFEYQAYADLNPDLKEAFGYNKYKLIEHFLIFGKNEGRNFNYDVESNPQLKLSDVDIFQSNQEDFDLHDRVCNSKYRISIKICAPNFKEGQYWGDFHYAQGLKRALIECGHDVRIDCKDAWETNLALKDDIVIVLRGRHQYKPKDHQINLIWLISHPDRVKDEELEKYDHIFVASKEYSEKLTLRLKTEVSCMYQCTDPSLFYPVVRSDKPRNKVLFIGSSRNVFRPIIQHSLAAGIDVSVYGPLWEEFISEEYIKGTYVPNEDLAGYYSNCTVLLNDHWDTMRSEGFLSNRLFDASACGAFIISDKVLGLERVFGDSIETYSDSEDLKNKVAYYNVNDFERLQKGKKARNIVLEGHTFAHRAKYFLEKIIKIQQFRQYNKSPNVGIEVINPAENIQLDTDNLSDIQKNSETNNNRFFLLNVASLENGICHIDSIQQSIFYKSIWQISRSTPSYGDFIKKFIDSEMKIDGILSSLSLNCRKPPLVSIIMPTFNRAYVIADAIQSVIEQTYQDWELLVCDDGSTDNTKGVIEQFQDSRIYYFQLPKANGAVARNFGLKYASGKYVAYLDSDNIWHPQHVQLCIQSLENNKNTMCCYTGYFDSEVVKTTVQLNNLACQTFDYYRLLDRNFIDLNSFFHHYDLIKWLGSFDESLPRLQDWDLVLRYTYFFEPLVIKNYTVFYRRNLAWNQVTNLFASVDVRSTVQQKVFNFLKSQDLSLNINMPKTPNILLVCESTLGEEGEKVLSLSKLLSDFVNVNILILGKLGANFSEIKNENTRIKFLYMSDEQSNLPSLNLFKNENFNGVVKDIAKDLNIEFFDMIMLLSCSNVCHSIGMYAKYKYKKPILMYNWDFKILLSRLYRLLDSENAENFSGQKTKCNYGNQNLTIKVHQEILECLQQSPPFLISETIESEQERFKSMNLGPTIASLSEEYEKTKKQNINLEKQNLGINKGDFVISFWHNDLSEYTLEEVKNFKKSFAGEHFKVLLVKNNQDHSRVKFDSNQRRVYSEGITIVESGSNQDAISILKFSDVCVIWNELETSSHTKIPLAFVYSAMVECYPIVKNYLTYSKWANLNYCKTIEPKDWQSLLEFCKELHARPKKLAGLKRNVRRLYDLKFSPHVIHEKLKYAILKCLNISSTVNQI